MSWEYHLKIQENKLSGKLMPWMIMSMEKCLTGGKNGRIQYPEEKIREINEAQPRAAALNFCKLLNSLFISSKQVMFMLNVCTPLFDDHQIEIPQG